MPHRKKDPSYRLHKQSGQAIVTLPDGLGGRHDVLLGQHDTQASWDEYNRVLAEWKAAGRRLPVTAAKAPDLTMNELMAAYWGYAQGYYVKDGRPTSEQATIHDALRFVRRLYAGTPAKDFGPLALKAVRQAMVEHPIIRKYKARDPITGKIEWREKLLHQGLARRYINKQLGRIKRMFGWAVEEELLPVAVHQALLRVKDLKKGKQQAREKQMRAIDIDMAGAVWEYRPRRYKTEHHNHEGSPDRERVVFLGPRAQALLKPYLTLNVTDFLFSPIRSEDGRNAGRRDRRETPLWPSHAKRKRRKRGGAPLRDHYDVASYRRAVRRACLKAGVPIWCPLQLRHARGTEVRKRFGLEASQAVLGHSELGVTQVYAEVDHDAARRVMAEIG
jgi:integrase